jgi:hypothetical protein
LEEALDSVLDHCTEHGSFVSEYDRSCFCDIDNGSDKIGYYDEAIFCLLTFLASDDSLERVVEIITDRVLERCDDKKQKAFKAFIDFICNHYVENVHALREQIAS